MNRKSLGIAIGVALAGYCSFGAVVNTAIAPGENSLFDILGMPDNSYAQVGGANGKQIAGDEVWNTAISSQLTSLLIEQAGGRNGNELGVYEIANLANKLLIFPGPANPVSSQTLLISGNTLTVGANSITVAGGNFGFYFKNNAGQYFYSQISDNTDFGLGKFDQMATYDLLDTKYGYTPYNVNNTGWILAWEDQYVGNPTDDKDYNDMVVSLTANPVPEPTTVIAGAMLLVPFGASTLRFMRNRRTT